MHQSTPPLPGFNAIRIDYIDSGRRRNLRSSLQTPASSFRSRPSYSWAVFEKLGGIGNQRQIVSGAIVANMKQLLFFADYLNGIEEG